VGPRAILDVVVKRKIPSPHQESNPRTPIVPHNVLTLGKCLSFLALLVDAVEAQTEHADPHAEDI
jgi:hypothetical protein